MGSVEIFPQFLRSHASFNMNEFELKLRAGGYYLPVTVQEQNGRWFFSSPPPWASPAAKALNDEIRAMVGRKWHKERKQWSVEICKRNQIALQYLTQGTENPFLKFEGEIQHFEPTRTLWQHQWEMLDFILSRHYCIIAGEQGVGKTLPLIEAGELLKLKPENYWYVGTVSSIEAVKYEYNIAWKAQVVPAYFYTYEKLKNVVNSWNENKTVPRFLIGDESSRLKGDTSERSIAFQFLADAVREVWGDDGFVVLLSGTPAPKDPADWWMQAEIVAPAFLKEGSRKILTQNLCKMNYNNINSAGQMFPKAEFWWDDENRCRHCGKYPDMHVEKTMQCLGNTDFRGRPTQYEKSVNEVSRLYKRLAPITIVKRKATCMDLPPKHYRLITCDTPDEIRELAKTVVDTASSGAEALILLRELSDGFMYKQEFSDEVIPCPRCGATGLIKTPGGVQEEHFLNIYDEDYEESEFDYLSDIEGGVSDELIEVSCPQCDGTGEAQKIIRKAMRLRSPKFDKLEGLLETHEEVGRIVVFAAFHASIDRIKEFCLKKLWTVFQVDGRGWVGTTPSGEIISKKDMLSLFQDKGREIDRIVWLGHPKSSGMGLTLTESPSAVYFSNPFNGEDRMQSEDRIHRAGMSETLGATIIDLVNLPTDMLILENLRNKVKLQNLTLGVVQDVIFGVRD